MNKTSEASMSGRQSRAPATRSKISQSGLLLALSVCVVIFFVALLGSYILARASNDSEMKAMNMQIVELQNENQKLTAENSKRAAALSDLQSRLNAVQRKLAEIMPSENTYLVHPNQSMIVGDGRLTIGLVGSPSNENVNIIINGKQESARAGSVIKTELDPSTTCQIGIQSFDMFKATLTAACTRR